MKILYMAILRNGTSEAFELSSEFALQDFNRFIRGKVQETISFFAEVVAQRTKPGDRLALKKDENDDFPYTFHTLGRSEGICGIVVTDLEYKPRFAQAVLSKICDEFITKNPKSSWENITKPKPKPSTAPIPYPELSSYIVKFQNPAEADPLFKIQGELDETTQITRKAIESLLERGEKIDNLVAKSDGLSAQSKMFYTQAKKQNSCCVVM